MKQGWEFPVKCHGWKDEKDECEGEYTTVNNRRWPVDEKFVAEDKDVATKDCFEILVVILKLYRRRIIEVRESFS